MKNGFKIALHVAERFGGVDQAEFDEKLMRSEALEALPPHERTESEHRELMQLREWFNRRAA